MLTRFQFIWNTGITLNIGPGKRGHIVADTNVSPFARVGNIPGHKKVSDFVQKHFVSATNVSQFAQHRKHYEQKRVRNNVSSFARVLWIDLMEGQV